GVFQPRGSLAPVGDAVTMKLQATHVTRYLYAEPVSTCHTEVHLKPRGRQAQILLEHELEVSPPPGLISTREDYFGNEVSSFTIDQPHRELVISARSSVELQPEPAPNLDLSPPWEDVRTETAEMNGLETFEAGQYVFESPYIVLGPPFAEYAAKSF